MHQANSTPSPSPAPPGRFLRLVDRFIPEDIRRGPPAKLRRLRLALGAALSLLFVNVTAAFPSTLILEGLSFDLALMAFGAVVCVTCLLLPRFTRSDSLPGLLFCLHAVVVIAFASYSRGPIEAAGVSWHVVVPLAASLLAGARAGLLCSGLSLTHLALLILRTAPLAPFDANPRLWGQINAFALTLFVGALAWVYETARQRAELEEAQRHLDEKGRLQRELEIASQIQSSILPGAVKVPGLQIAARMVPASEVGGDYYDVLPVRGGCWIGIGDVSGHGLNAGLIMMMVQSTIASLSRHTPDASPRELLNLSNQVLFHNIRSRLKRDDFITLALLRYREDGQVVLAGAHEDPVVYRAKEKRCELVETQGAWIGAMQSVERFTVDTRLQLEPGDRMLLYTDGITEAMNERGALFGFERMVAEFQRACERGPVEQVLEHLLACVRAWTQSPQDDMTLVVIEHRGEGGARVTAPAQLSA